MEITSSKGHAFRTEPRCDVSVHEGRAAGGSGNRGPLAAPSPHVERARFAPGRRACTGARGSTAGATHLVLCVVSCVHTVNGEGAPSSSPLGVPS